MRFIITLILGLIYGLCEFLPFSGSGILYLIYSLSPSTVSASDAGIIFCFLNLGVMFSVLVYFSLHAPFLPEPEFGKRRRKKKIGNFLQNLPASVRPLLLVSTLPLFLLFIRFKAILVVEKGRLFGVALAFAVSGVLLLASIRFSRGGKKASNVSLWDAILVGLGQMFSFLPGLSRSVSTITCGLYSGMDYEFATDYSILLSAIPYFGAAGLMFVRSTELGINWSIIPACISAMIFAFCGGYCSIHLFKKVFRPDENRVFALVSFGLAALSLVLSLIH